MNVSGTVSVEGDRSSSLPWKAQDWLAGAPGTQLTPVVGRTGPEQGPASAGPGG